MLIKNILLIKLIFQNSQEVQLVIDAMGSQRLDQQNQCFSGQKKQHQKFIYSLEQATNNLQIQQNTLIYCKYFFLNLSESNYQIEYKNWHFHKKVLNISETSIVMKMGKKVVVILGHTQTGKSSALKDLTGDNSIICGKVGYGASTTQAIKIHRPITPKIQDNYIFMDTIGFGDNTLNFTPQQIKEQIELNILTLSQAQKCDEIQGIVITQSLRDSSHQLRNHLKFITQIFGDLPNRSVVVLGTKAHLQQQDEIHERENAILEIMEQFNIPKSQYIKFDTSYPKLLLSQISQKQYRQFQTALSNCFMINANKSIKEKRNQINVIAKRIQVEKTQVKHHPYTHTWTQERWNGDIGKIFGSKKTKVFSEIRYNTTTHEPPMEYCTGLALQQFEKTVRQKMIKK